MHELSIAKNIIDIVKETLSREHVEKLVKVKIQVGQLVAVVPDSLQFCYQTLVQDTPYDHSKLLIEIVPIKDVVMTDWSTEEAMTFVVTGGTNAPENIHFSTPKDPEKTPPATNKSG